MGILDIYSNSYCKLELAARTTTERGDHVTPSCSTMILIILLIIIIITIMI